MSAIRVDYKNYGFQYSPDGAFIRSVFGNRNYKAKNFSGIKTASRPWGWQWRQFSHPDSTYDVVYRRQRTRIINHLNNSQQYSDSVFDENNPLQHNFTQTIDQNGAVLPVQPFGYIPSKTAFETNQGVGTYGAVGAFKTASSPTLCERVLGGVSPAGRYTCEVELLEPSSLAGIIADVRARIAMEPNPDYDDPTNTRFYSDNWSYGYIPATNRYGWSADSIKKPEPIPTEPYLLSHVTATQILQDFNIHAFSYALVSARKIGITIFNTRLNQLTIEKYCRSEWTGSTYQDNTHSFSAHRGCQMITNLPGARPFNILVDLPGEDPVIKTPDFANGPTGLLSLRGQTVGNEFCFPGYPAEGYPPTLPPPGPCCVLT
jgi:hypothetical protein